MRRAWVAVAAAVLALAGVGFSSAHGSTRTPPPVQHLVVGGRPVDVFRPAGRVTAVVVLLHGYELPNTDVEQHSGLIGPGLARGWLMVFPDGVAGSWDAGLCCGTAVRQKVDDTGFLVGLVDSLRAENHLGRSAPTVMGGFSNGAMMAEEVMCRRPGVVDVAVLMAGNLQDPRCDSARAREIVLIRGSKDTTVPIDGLRHSTWLGTRLLPDSDTLDAATRGLQCEPPALARSAAGGTTVLTETCGADRLTDITEGGGHDWLVGGSAPGSDTTDVIEAAVARAQRR